MPDYEGQARINYVSLKIPVRLTSEIIIVTCDL